MDGAVVGVGTHYGGGVHGMGEEKGCEDGE